MKKLSCEVGALPVLGKGGNGTVYQLNEEQIIKVFSQRFTLEMIERERERSKAAFLLGIPTAIAFEVVEIDGGYGTIFEMLDGRTLSSAINRDAENLVAYTQKFAELVKTLHGVALPDPIEPRFEKAHIESKLDQIRSGLTRQTALSDAVKARILGWLEMACAGQRRCLHGDLHSNNVLVDGNGEMMFIDMGDMSYGDPDVDIANMYKTYPLSGPSRATAGGFSGLNLELFEPFLNAFNRAYFTDRQPDQRKIQTLIMVTTLMFLDSPHISAQGRDFLVQNANQAFGG